MCDYSVHAKQARHAVVGDELITSNFRGGHTGFADMNDPDTVICLRPGTELSFDKDIVESHPGYFKANLLTYNTKVARFGQTNLDDPCTLHDMLEFPDGESCYVGFLQPGQRATVIQLPAVISNVTQAEKLELPELPEPVETAIKGARSMRRAFERVFG